MKLGNARTLSRRTKDEGLIGLHGMPCGLSFSNVSVDGPCGFHHISEGEMRDTGRGSRGRRGWSTGASGARLFVQFERGRWSDIPYSRKSVGNSRFKRQMW